MIKQEHEEPQSKLSDLADEVEARLQDPEYSKELSSAVERMLSDKKTRKYLNEVKDRLQRYILDQRHLLDEREQARHQSQLEILSNACKLKQKNKKVEELSKLLIYGELPDEVRYPLPDCDLF